MTELRMGRCAILLDVEGIRFFRLLSSRVSVGWFDRRAAAAGTGEKEEKFPRWRALKVTADQVDGGGRH